MVNIIIQLSKYVIIILMAAYTFSCFSIFTRNYEDEEKRVLIRQDVLMFLLQFAAFGTMYLATKDIRINQIIQKNDRKKNHRQYCI